MMKAMKAMKAMKSMFGTLAGIFVVTAVHEARRCDSSKRFLKFELRAVLAS